MTDTPNIPTNAAGDPIAAAAMFATYVASARADGIRVDPAAIADELESMGYAPADVLAAIKAPITDTSGESIWSGRTDGYGPYRDERR